MISLLSRLLVVCVLVVFPGLSLAQAPNGSGVDVTMAFSPSTIVAGTQSNLTVTFQNSDNGSPVSGVGFDATMPAGMTIGYGPTDNSCGFANFSAPSGGTTLSMSGLNLAPAASCTITVPATSSTAASYTLSNTTWFSDNGAGSGATAILNVNAPSGNPSVSKSLSLSSLDPGSATRVTYDFITTSTGFLQFTLNETLPAGLELASPANALTTCNGVTLPLTGTITAASGGSSVSAISYFYDTAAGTKTCEVSFDVKAVSSGSYGLSGTVSGVSGTFVAPLTVNDLPSGTIALQKTFGVSQAAAGDIVPLTFTLNNNTRSETGTAITFSDDLDAMLSGTTLANPVPANPCGAGSSITGTASNIILSGGTLAPSASCSFTLDVQLPASVATTDTYVNVTSALSGQLDGTPFTSNTASATLRVAADGALPLVLTKSYDGDAATAGSQPEILPGNVVVVSYEISNPNTATGATAVTFTDPLDAPAGLVVDSYLSNTCGGSNAYSPTSGFFLGNGTVAANSSCTVEVAFTVSTSTAPGDYPSVTGAISATLGSTSTVGQGATATLTVLGGARLNMVKVFTESTVAAGSVADVVVTITNAPESASTAQQIIFLDDLDAFLTGATYNGILGGSCSPTTNAVSGASAVDILVASLAAGQSCDVTFGVNIPAATNGEFTNTTSALVASAGGQATVAAAASAPLKVLPTEPLVTTKQIIGSPVIPGDTFIARYTLTNPSTVFDYTSLSFIDNYRVINNATNATTLPTGAFCGASSVVTQATSGFLSFSGLSIAAGTSCTFDVEVSVPASTADMVYSVNTGVLQASVGGSTVNLSPITASVEVLSDAFEFAKSYSDTAVQSGGQISADYVITNPLNAALANLAFNDPLSNFPSGTTLASSSVGTCGGTISEVGAQFQYSGGSLAALASCTVSMTFDIPAAAVAGEYSGATTAPTGEISGPPVLAVNATAATASFTVRAFSYPQVSLVLSPTVVGAGSQMSATYQFQNTDTATTLTDLKFNDDLDAVVSGMTIAPGSLASTCSGAAVTGEGGGDLSVQSLTLAPSQTCTVSMDLSVPSGAASGAYTTLSSPLTDAGIQLAAPVSQSFNVVPAPAISAAFGPSMIAQGGVSTLTYTIDNTGAGFAATAVAIAATLDTALEVATPANASTTCTGGTLTAVAGSTGFSYAGGTAAASSSCTVALDVRALSAGNVTQLSGDLTSSFGNSGTASAALNVTAAPIPALTKSFAAPSVSYNGTTTMTLIIDNSSALIEASSLDVTDNLPAGMVVAATPNASSTCTGGTLTAVSESSVVSYTGGTVPASGTCAVNVDVALTTPGSFVNTTGNLTSSLGSSSTASAALKLPGVGISTPIAGDDIITTTDVGPIYLSGVTTQVEDGEFVDVKIIEPSAAFTTYAVPVSGGTWTLAVDLQAGEDGVVQIEAQATDANGAVSALQTASVIRDITVPTGQSVSFDVPFVNAANQTSVGFSMADAELAATYAYSITSSGGGAAVTGSGTIAVAAEQISGLDLSGLGDGTLTVSVVLTDPRGNPAPAVTATVEKDTVAPGVTIDSPIAGDDVVNAAEVSATTISGTSTGLQDGEWVSIDISGNSVTVQNGAQVTGGIWSILLDLNVFSEGPLTVTVYATDTAGNPSAQQQTTILKDTIAPAGATVAFDQGAVNAANQTAISFAFTDVEVGASYSYSIASGGGGAPVTGTGTFATTADQLTGLDLSGLGEGVLTLSVTITDTAGNAAGIITDTINKDVSAPGLAFDTPLAGDDLVNASEASSVVISGTAADLPDGRTVTIAVTDGAAGTVPGTAFVAGGIWSTTLDLSGLADGALALTADTSDVAGNPAPQATAALTKDTVAPVGYTVAVDQASVNAANETAISFAFTGAEVGAGYTYAFTSTGGGTPVSGSGLVLSATDQLTGIDLSGLGDGVITLSVTLTDTAGNAGISATDEVDKDVLFPAVAFDGPFAGDDIVNAAEVTSVTLDGTVSDIPDGQSVSVILTDQFSATVSGTAIAGGGVWSLSLDLSGLADGPLALTADVSDLAGNPAPQATAALTKDTVAPTGYSAVIDQDPVNLSNVTAVSFSFAGAEVGATYNVSLSSSGSAIAATQSGIVPIAAGQLTGFDLTPLSDGTLTLSLALTDAAGNAGVAVTDTALKDTAVPSATLTAPTDAQSDPFEMTVVFGEPVTGLALAGFDIDNGTASDLLGSGDTYTFTVTPDHDGDVTITVLADSAQDPQGNGNAASDPVVVVADLTGTPDPAGSPDADGDGVPDEYESSTADRDGDGIPDASDYDPQGYFYCEDDGRILSGGGISVSGPAGTNSSVGLSNDINIVQDGSSGSFQWFATRPGTYTVSYSYPTDEGLPSTTRLSAGAVDVTSLLPSNPAVLGSTEVGSTGMLADASLAANPVFYSTFVIEAGDPYVLANNIPMTQCAENPVRVTAPVNGAEANGGTPVDAEFVITQDRRSSLPTVVSYTMGGTATAGSDYTAPSGTATIAAGDLSVTIAVPVLEDGVVEGPETLIMTLTAIASGDTATILSTTASDLSATATITDDDSAVISVTDLDLSTSESGNDDASMSFVLLGRPTADVVLSFAGDAQCSVAPATITFTSANYASPQLLTIRARNDEKVEGLHSCQPTVSVGSSDAAFDGYALALSPVQVTDDLVDQIRDPLTEILKNDLEQTVRTQQRGFSRIAKGALGRLQAGQDNVPCGTVSAPDVDGRLTVQDGVGTSEGKFGWDVYNCYTMRREILDGTFSLNWSDSTGTQAILQFARQSEKFTSDKALSGYFWGGYFSRNNVDGLADGTINGYGLNGGVYGARDLGTGLFLDYYASGAIGMHRYDLTFNAAPANIDATGSYRYAAIFGGVALSGTREYENFTMSPRVGLDLAHAWVSDADVTAKQLGQTDTGSIDLPDFSGGRLFAEIEFAGLGTQKGAAELGQMLTETTFTPRVACEFSSYDNGTECSAGINLAVMVTAPTKNLSYGFEIDYERMSEINRLSLDFTRERRFAHGQGAVVTRLSMPAPDSVAVEHGVKLDW
ncbi:Ig-like domain-containing protein [Primorskyibacter sp. 2E233]|uniref:DUF7933 domain-containing protein n=1 Tax=Primorskyibacter sp. 2E233 TaxID=3413431 RepID=UPI003BF24227